MPCNCIGKIKNKQKVPVPPKPPTVRGAVVKAPFQRVRYIYSPSLFSHEEEHPDRRFRESY